MPYDDYITPKNRNKFSKDTSLLRYNEKPTSRVKIKSQYLDGLQQLCVLNESNALNATTGLIDLNDSIGGFKLNPLGYGINIRENGNSANSPAINNSVNINPVSRSMSCLVVFKLNGLNASDINPVFSKYSTAGNFRSFIFSIRTAGNPNLFISSNGSGFSEYAASNTLQLNTLYTILYQWWPGSASFSTNGANYQEINTTETSIFANSEPHRLGNIAGFVTNSLAGEIYFASFWFDRIFKSDEANSLTNNPYQILESE